MPVEDSLLFTLFQLLPSIHFDSISAGEKRVLVFNFLRIS
jgi:hypothetical protein